MNAKKIIKLLLFSNSFKNKCEIRNAMVPRGDLSIFPGRRDKKPCVRKKLFKITQWNTLLETNQVYLIFNWDGFSVRIITFAIIIKSSKPEKSNWFENQASG